MRRRPLLIGSAAAAALGWPAAAVRAQAPARPMRLGWLRPTTPVATEYQATGIPAALRRLGWVVGQNLVIESRFADGHAERLPALAAELVQARCDAILSVGTGASLAIAKATSSIPIVMFGNFDPVARGLVSNLARPGGNLTGVMIAPDGSLAIKRLEVLREAAPRAGRFGLLAPDDPTFDAQVAETRAAAASLGVELAVVAMRGRPLEAVFGALAAGGTQALVVGAHTSFMGPRQAIAGLAIRRRWATSWEWAEQVRDGGLLAYGTSLTTLYDRIAGYLDRLFKGARAGDLPIERPSTFGLTLNLKTAQAIGLVLPPPLLLRADEVIS